MAHSIVGEYCQNDIWTTALPVRSFRADFISADIALVAADAAVESWD